MSLNEFLVMGEVGHMMDESFKSECLSGDSAFAKLFSKAWKGIDQNEPNAIILGGLKNDELRKNEVFADMWGHLKPAPAQRTSTLRICVVYSSRV